MKQKIFGQKIRNIREKFGLSQEEVEKSLGLPQKTMTLIETGQRNVSSLELTDLADLFYCRVADFFLEEEVEDDFVVTLYRLNPGLEADREIPKEVSEPISIQCEKISRGRSM